MNSNAEILDHFRDEYLAYLEGDRDEPPPLDDLPDAVRRTAEAFVESITAARGVDPYASRPSIEQLLAAHSSASEIVGGFGEVLQTHLRSAIDPYAAVTPDVAADALGLESELVIHARGMRLRMVRGSSSARLDSALPIQADGIAALFAAFPGTDAVLYATSGREPLGVVVDRGDICPAIETPSGEHRDPRLRRSIADAKSACEMWLRGIIPEFEPLSIGRIEPTPVPESVLNPFLLAAKAVGEVSEAGSRARIEAKRSTWGAFGNREAQLLASIIEEVQSGLLSAAHYEARLDEIVGAAV